MPRKNTTKQIQPFMLDRYPTKIKCTFRKSKFTKEDFTMSPSGDYTYYEEFTDNDCKIVYSLRVNGKYPNRLFKADYPAEISVTGSTELWGIRLAALIPTKNLKITDPEGIRKEELTFSNKDVSISATFEIKNQKIIDATRQKMKSRH